MQLSCAQRRSFRRYCIAELTRVPSRYLMLIVNSRCKTDAQLKRSSCLDMISTSTHESHRSRAKNKRPPPFSRFTLSCQLSDLPVCAPPMSHRRRAQFHLLPSPIMTPGRLYRRYEHPAPSHCDGSGQEPNDIALHSIRLSMFFSNPDPEF